MVARSWAAAGQVESWPWVGASEWMAAFRSAVWVEVNDMVDGDGDEGVVGGEEGEFSAGAPMLHDRWVHVDSGSWTSGIGMVFEGSITTFGKSS